MKESKTSLKKLKLSVLSIFLLTAATTLNGSIIEANKYGNFVNTVNARDYSTGDGWVTQGFKYGIGNEKGFGISYSPSIFFISENRSEYIFDVFDNTIGKQTTGYSSNYFLDHPLNFRAFYNTELFEISAGLEPVISAHWKFEDIERDDFYQIIKEEIIESSAIINGVFINFVWNFANIHTGIKGKWLYGKYSYSRNIDTLESEFYHSGSGYELEAMLTYQLGWRIKAIIRGSSGARFKTPVNEYEYPYRIGAGIVLRPVHKLPAVANFEVVFIPWEKLKINNLTGYDVLNTYYLSGGIEHRINPNLNFRLGYLWSPSMINRKITHSKFTGGIGYQKSEFAVDLSASLSKLSFDGSEVSIVGVGDYEDKIIDETETRLILTITKLFEVK